MTLEQTMRSDWQEEGFYILETFCGNNMSSIEEILNKFKFSFPNIIQTDRRKAI